MGTDRVVRHERFRDLCRELRRQAPLREQLDEERQVLFPLAREGGDIEACGELPVHPDGHTTAGAGSIGPVAAMIQRARPWTRGDPAYADDNAIMYLPLVSNRRLVAVLRLEAFLLQKPGFDDNDFSLLSMISEHAGIAIETAWIRAHAKAVATEHMQEVTETTRGYLRDALAAGIREGEDTRTIRKRLLEVPGFDGGDARAVMVARTEVTRSSNYGQVESWKASDGAVTEKRWIATADSTTRESHRELNGQVQKLDQPFHVNGHAGMYPGDFGEAAEDINCRCTVGAVISDPDLSDFDALEDAANWSFTRGAEPSEEQLARAWRAYVKAVAPWEKTTAADVRRGFEGQRDDFERAIGGVLGRKTPVNTPRRGGSRS